MKLRKFITRRPKRANIRRGLICLVFGIVVTVTVAWCCVLYSEQELVGVEHSDTGILERYRPRQWPTFDTFWDYRGIGVKERFASAPLYIESAPGQSEPDLNSHGGLIMTERYSGFPWIAMRSLQSEVRIHNEWFSEFEGVDFGRPEIPFLDRGWVPPGWMPIPGWPRVLPLRPMWPGALYSVLFYSVLVFPMVCLGEYGWRRRHFRVDYRRRHGQCLKCKYPAGEFAVCPECGTPVAGDE